MSRMAAAACSVDRSWPEVSGPRMSGQLKVTRSRGAAPLAHDAPTFLFGAPSPDPITLSGAECMLETRLAYRAPLTHELGHLGLFVGHGIEDLRIETMA